MILATFIGSILDVRRAWVVRVVGLEPTLHSEANFKSAASANSATPAARAEGRKLTYGEQLWTRYARPTLSALALEGRVDAYNF